MQTPTTRGLRYCWLMTTLTTPARDYGRWSPTHIQWGSSTEFAAAAPWIDGIHSIDCGGGPSLDILVSGQPHIAGPVLPVFFNGAVTDRETKSGPFFSGSGIAAKAGFPFIALSDPSLELDASLGLAWYAGNRFGNIQDEITAVLDAIARGINRELLLVGGSGGGFAALYYGGRLNEVASAIVWNPQTDIYKYNPIFVENYLRHAWGKKDCLAKTSVVGCLPKRLLFMQNANDWHVPNHTQPFLEAASFKHRGRGVFEADANHVVCLASYGDGHAPLPEPVITTAINLMTNPTATASQAVDGVISRHATEWSAPLWSHPHLMKLPPMEVAALTT